MIIDNQLIDYFKGALSLDLANMTKGSSNSKSCTLNILGANVPTTNIFKVKRTKAWWPLVSTSETGNYTLAVITELLY